MTALKLRVTLTSGFLMVAASGAHAQIGANKMVIPRGSLCVTEGAVDSQQGDRFSVDTAKMRAYVNGWTSQAIEAHFTYLGPTVEESRLGSGDIRRQFGLKLRAQNACNLVYVMWRFEPQSKIVVSVKKNPGETTSAECGNRGYRNIRANHSRSAPAVHQGDTHDVDAEMQGTELKVTVDGNEVWDGDVGPVAAGLKGPVGIRSDNVRLAFDLGAGPLDGPHPHFLVACKSGPEVSD